MNNQNKCQINELNQINSSSNNNCMSIIKTYIDYSSTDSRILKNLFNLEKIEAAKLELENFKKIETSQEKIQSILFDKTIFALLNKQKMPEREYHYLFYIFFIQEIYCFYIIELGHKNFSKFFKKFFNSCMKSKMFEEQEIVTYTNFYLIQLFQLITACYNECEISELKKHPIIAFNNKDDYIKIKYMKFLIKYILALTNFLDSKKNYKNYQIFIFETLLSVPIFNDYYMKQLNKIYLKKGIFSFSNNFIKHLLYPIINKSYEQSVHETSEYTKSFIKSILYYQPKYLINKNNSTLDNNFTPFYFLNIPILLNILRDMISNDDFIQKLIFKLINMFNNKINLFIDESNKLRVAELLLLDTINDRIIRNNLDIIEIIKPYFKNEEKNQNNFYFDTLFYDLCLEQYILLYLSIPNEQKKEINNANDSYLNQSNSQSIDLDDYNFTDKNISKKKSKQYYIDLIIKKYNNTNNFIINKYFRKTNDDNLNFDDFLSNKNLEELFILLDFLYLISINSDENNIIKNSISDIKKIIVCIIKKSFNENKFNCTIFDVIINIDKKYIPLSSEFSVITSNEILIKNSFVTFIKTYPLFLIFVINFYPKNNLPIAEFLKILKAFMIGYYTNVFNQIEENMNNYNHTLQFNYLNIIYFIIEQILDIYESISKNNNSINDCNKKIMKYLTYCLNCQKKVKNHFILSKYLIECVNCGEKCLFINTNLYDYLKKEKNELKKFIDECIFNVITGLTCNMIYKFIEKYEKRDKISMFCYSLYYKIMCEHFNFLNYIKLKLGKKIPYIINTSCEINNKEGALDENIKLFFDNYITDYNNYSFRTIYETIEKDKFISFNLYRKTIKHEYQLSKCKSYKL